MPAITSQNVAQAILKVIAMRGLPAVMSNLVMGNLVNRDFEAVLGNAGDVVNVPIPAVLSANRISEGGSVTTQNPSLGNAQVVLNTHTEATFQIPNVTQALVGADSGDFSLLDKYLEPAMIAIAEAVETDLLNLYTNLTANTPVGTATVTITEAAVDAAEKALFDARVPQGAKKNLVVSSQTYTDLRQIPRFTEDRIISGAGQNIVEGTVGKIKNFDVYRSQLVSKVSTTTNNVAFARDAFALVTRRLPQPITGTGAIAEYAEMGSFGMRVVISYAPNTLAQQFTVDILYGCGVLRNPFGVTLLS